MNIRMKRAYYEVFDNGNYRLLAPPLVYDVERSLAKTLVDLDIADELELGPKKTENVRKEEPKHVEKPAVRESKPKKFRAGDGTVNASDKRGRRKKRAKN